ncbi:MAG: protein kinase [Myxococcales bacterium]|nr:protein kinase [Myxococcales bacterium]
MSLPNLSERFKVEAELGHGANSVVYRAQIDGQPCALKLPRSKGTWTRWVYREAVALARVRDPGLPAILEVGEVDGLPFLAMELVEGETLAARIRRAPLARDEVLDIAVTVLRALDSVHDAGLVHRDVKPKNLILGSDNRVRLVDFGFATPIERAGESETDLAGTPGYAAPEQLHAPARLDGRADLYALGVVVFECLVGRLPDRGERVDLVSGTLGELLASWVAGLLAGDPELRYPSARAALADLERARASRAPLGPTAYAPPSTRAPMIGRDVELSRLAESFAEVRSHGSVLLARGGRGAGKSRFLCAAAEAWSEAGRLRTLSTSCFESDVPWAALRRLFDAYLAAMRRATAPDRAALQEALVHASDGSLGALAAFVNPAFGELLGTRAEPTAPASVSEGLAELLVRLFRRVGPVLVTVDDLQWIDAPSSEVFVRLAHRAQEAPVVLLLATRVDATGETPVARFRASELPRATVVDLRELDSADAARLVTLRLGSPAASDETLAQVAALSDGTPLGVLEVLGAMLDTGAIRLERGKWQLDRARAERAALPARSFELLGRRVEGLPPASARVIEQAAVLGQVFEDALLAEVLEIPLEHLGYALAEARRAGVLVIEGADRHRFVHDGLREIVLARLGTPAVRAAHQRTAEALMRRPAGSVGDLFVTASHYAAGDLDASPAAAYAAYRRAAQAAIDSFDNKGALRFLELAEKAALRAKIGLDETFYRSRGEADLRMGSLEPSRAGFESALLIASSARARAEILGRIAWVHQTAAEPDESWRRLGEAFAALGQTMPVEDARSAGNTLAQLARMAISGTASTRAAAGVPPESIAVLCDLHYQNARLGLEYGKPARLVQSTLQALELSARLGPSRAQSRTRAMKGFVLTALGRKDAGARALGEALEIAERIGDPVSRVFALQLRATAAGFSGAFDAMIRDLEDLIGDWGHWLELNEYCLNIGNADVIESIRGRARESTKWIDRAMSRLMRSEQRTAVFDQMLLYRVRASRAAAGLPTTDLPEPAPPRGFFRLVSWGARARVFLENDQLGPSFEAFVREFEEEGIRARGAHPVLAEYYITIAHARAHQCLRADPNQRASCVALLRRAVEDVGHVAKAPLFRAHVHLLEAHVAFFSAKKGEARKLLAKAETTAREETCPWVLYGAARLRAHMALDEGRPDAARDEARIAEALAVEHGAVTRARWIREELSLPAPAATPAEHELSSRSSTGGSRYLTALVDVARASNKQVSLVPRARAILDELLRDVDGTRGVFWLAGESPDLPPTVVGRTRQGGDLDSIEDRLGGVLAAVTRTVCPWPEPADASASVRAAVPWIPDLDPRRSIALPLPFANKVIGALFVERAPERPAISPAVRRLVAALAETIAISLELARLLEERDRLQRSLMNAQKMEAVGRLAGGVAHDINNMLSVTQLALDRLRASSLSDNAEEEVGVLVEGTERAKHLVQQLLTFSKARGGAKTRLHLHEIILRNQALIRTLAGKSVVLELKLLAASAMIVAEPALLEQSLFNLVTNARDAMGDAGGTLTFATENVSIQVPSPGRAPPGHHVVLSITDTGHGMTEDVAARVFEPFFTTKSEGRGTGLGLATVYGLIESVGGYVEVQSKPGVGTTFKLWLPVTAPARAFEPKPVPRRGAVLVVDDEELVANSLRRILEGAGHHVLVALNARDALDVARKNEPDIALALVDVRLADSTGPQLVEKLWQLEVPRKVIYMSGHLPEEVLRELGDAPIVDKPFRTDDILRRVEIMKNA